MAWERGRPARILSLWPPLSFSATLQAATLSAETASAGPKESHGAVAGRSKWRRWPRLCQAWCGRDARAPGKPSSCGRDARAPREPSSHDIVTPRAQICRSILVPLVVEGGPSVFVSLPVPSCPFVVHLHERSAVIPRMIRTAGRGHGSRANRSFPQGARRHSEKSPGAHPPPHQPSPGGSASATPPQGGSDWPGSAGVPPASCPFGRR